MRLFEQARLFRPVRGCLCLASLAALLAGPLLLSGCLGSRVDHRRYFSLPTAGASNAAVQSQSQRKTQRKTQPKTQRKTQPKTQPSEWPGTVHVATFAVSPVLDRVGLVLRRSDVEVRYSANHVWVQRPQRLVSDRVAAATEATGVFRRVVRDLSENSPDWTLRGRVLAFDVLTAADGGGPWRVRVTLNMSLRSVRDGQLIWRQRWSREATLAEPKPALAARKIGQLVDTAIEEALVAWRRIPAAQRHLP